MALNAASHNPTAEPTGSPSGPPPPVGNSLMGKVAGVAKQDSTGQNVGGMDKRGNDEGQTVIGEAGKEKTREEVELEEKGEKEVAPS